MLKVLIETQQGWKVCAEAENGDEAVAKVLEYRPDIVVMDMAMPVRDGISASREISASAPTTPIVMHTLHYSAELEIEAKKAGVWAVVPKAEASDELLKAINGLLRRSAEASAAGNGVEGPRVAGAEVNFLSAQNGNEKTASTTDGATAQGDVSLLPKPV
jgi:DNA-binding NarL/FixJ family response regulator